MSGNIVVSIFTYVLAVAIGFFVSYLINKLKISKANVSAAKIIDDATAKADTLVKEAILDAKTEVYELKLQAEKERTRAIRHEFEQFQKTTEAEEVVLETDAKLLRKIEKLRDKERRRENRNRERGQRTEASSFSVAPVEEKLTFEPGDKVRIKGQVVAGEISKVEGSRCYVAFGHLISQIDVQRLEHISASEYKKQQKENLLHS